MSNAGMATSIAPDYTTLRSSLIWVFSLFALEYLRVIFMVTSIVVQINFLNIKFHLQNLKKRALRAVPMLSCSSLSKKVHNYVQKIFEGYLPY